MGPALHTIEQKGECAQEDRSGDGAQAGHGIVEEPDGRCRGQDGNPGGHGIGGAFGQFPHQPNARQGKDPTHQLNGEDGRSE